MSETLTAPSFISLRTSIAGLALGKSLSRSERLDMDDLTRRSLIEIKSALYNSIQSSTRRAAAETGNRYTIESGEWLTRTQDLVLTILVTRIE